MPPSGRHSRPFILIKDWYMRSLLSLFHHMSYSTIEYFMVWYCDIKKKFFEVHLCKRFIYLYAFKKKKFFFVGGEDHWSARDLVLWPPVP
jgi:hypothetical protein